MKYGNTKSSKPHNFKKVSAFNCYINKKPHQKVNCLSPISQVKRKEMQDAINEKIRIQISHKQNGINMKIKIE